MKKSDAELREFLHQWAVLQRLIELDRRGQAKFTIPSQCDIMQKIFTFVLCNNGKMKLTEDDEVDGQLTDREEECRKKWERAENIVTPSGKKHGKEKAFARKKTQIIRNLIFKELQLMRGET